MTKERKGLAVALPVPYIPVATTYRSEIPSMGSFLELNDGNLLYAVGTKGGKRYRITEESGTWEETGPFRLANSGTS